MHARRTGQWGHDWEGLVSDGFMHVTSRPVQSGASKRASVNRGRPLRCTARTRASLARRCRSAALLRAGRSAASAADACATPAARGSVSGPTLVEAGAAHAADTSTAATAHDVS